MYRSRYRTSDITISALFIALTAVCSWISIPVPGTSVPINMATFAVILAGVTLGARRSSLAMIIFLLLGSIGVPVFHSLTGGVGIVFGPTGGFLIGYIALAFLSGLSAESANAESRRILPFIPAVLFGEIALYAFGTAWFIFQSGTPLQAALLACVVPFIPGDILKIILVYLVKGRLEKALA